MATASTSFTAVGVGSELFVRHGESFTFAVSGTFVGTVVLERSEDGTNFGAVSPAVSTTVAATGTVNVNLKTTNSHAYYRWNCTAFTSGTIVTTVVDVADEVPGSEIIDADGAVLFVAEDGGVRLPGNVALGDATADLIAFHGSTKVDQASAYTQTYSTADKTHAARTAGTMTDNTTGAATTTLAAGAGYYTLAFKVTFSTITDADLVTDYIVGHKFKLIKFDVAVDAAVTTAAKASTFTLDIGATPTTGGAIALTSANATPKGVVVAGSAITAANTGSASDTLTIKAASTTTFIEGDGWLLVQVQNMDTADAFASLSDQHDKLLADQIDTAQVANSVVDDLQEKGLVG